MVIFTIIGIIMVVVAALYVLVAVCFFVFMWYSNRNDK